MKKILFLLLLSIISYNVFAQAPSKKCPTCGQSMAKCQYKGKHPKKTQQKPTQLVKPTAKPTTGTVNGHEWVDLGLSVKWATMNVGASKPGDYGGYYAWGEITTKSEYTWSNCFDRIGTGISVAVDSEWGTYKKNGQNRITTTSGHDTAHENWGSTWRMPTHAENDELCKKCTWEWTTQDGHHGYRVTGPNGNSIFLPAAGQHMETSLYETGNAGYYWSNTLDSSGPHYASCLYYNEKCHWKYIKEECRRYGLSVRPVTE